jgi:branched-chain amino acid transport system substrate-binding protein
VNGAQIELVTKDAPDANSGVSAVESLTNVENVDVIAGSYSSTISRASTQRAAGFNMPYWELGAVADVITQENPGNTFRTNPMASFFGESGVATTEEVIAPALEKSVEDMNVAVMYESGAYGNSVGGTVKSLSEEAGMNVVADIEYDAGTSDLSSSIQKLKSADVDVINHTGYSSDIYLLWNQSEDLDNYIPAAVGNGGGYSLQAFVENIGTQTALGVFNEDFTQYNTNPEYAPGIEEFVGTYSEAYGDPPLSGHSLANYFGMNVLLDTLAQMDSPSDFTLSEMKDAALSLDREVGTSATSWGVSFEEGTLQNTRTTVTGHQWQADTYSDDIWHPDRTDGTADLYTLYPDEGRLDFAEVKNVPRPEYHQQ